MISTYKNVQKQSLFLTVLGQSKKKEEKNREIQYDSSISPNGIWGLIEESRTYTSNARPPTNLDYSALVKDIVRYVHSTRDVFEITLF